MPPRRHGDTHARRVRRERTANTVKAVLEAAKCIKRDLESGLNGLDAVESASQVCIRRPEHWWAHDDNIITTLVIACNKLRRALAQLSAFIVFRPWNQRTTTNLLTLRHTAINRLRQHGLEHVRCPCFLTCSLSPSDIRYFNGVELARPGGAQQSSPTENDHSRVESDTTWSSTSSEAETTESERDRSPLRRSQ